VSILRISSFQLTEYIRFLWVNLQLQQLCRTSRGQDDQELREALDRLPQGLAAMYTRILDDIASGDKYAPRVALECFRWMVYAKQKLSLDDMRVVVTLLKSPVTAQELMSRLSPCEFILEECRNLVHLSETGIFNKSIDPIHFSFMEYLQNLPLDKLQGDFWISLADSRDSENFIACRCIEWLLLALPEHWELADTFAAYMHLSYPTKYFDRHALCASSGSLGPPSNLLATVNRLLRADVGKIASLVKLRLMRMPMGMGREGRKFDEALSQNYLLWTSDLYLIPGLSSEWLELEIPKYALHFAVWFRPGGLQSLLSKGHYVDELDTCQRTPLSYACAKGCLTSVEVLLCAGARPDANSWRKSPLGLAIQNDHLELTRFLLKVKVNILIGSDPEGHVPLMMAASLRMVQLLSEACDFDLNATDCVGRSILGYYVGITGLERRITPTEATYILGYLISRGADMYAKSMAGMNLVDYAVCRADGGEPLAFLLQRDPKLIAQEIEEWSSLHWACRRGNFRMAEILLEHGSKANKVTTIQPPRDWTPYDILEHYGEDLREFDESTTHALGRPEKIRLSANPLSLEQIDYGSLQATNLRRRVECSLCAMPVFVRKIVPHFSPFP
jgi:ankyrin repeat protein